MDNHGLNGKKLPWMLASNSGYMHASNIITDAGVDDWLISPELYDCGQEIVFYARSIQEKDLEDFQVLYSMDSDKIEDFEVLDQYEQIPWQWTRYVAHLPEGARYFAIRSYSGKFCFMVCLLYTSPSPRDS